ncbi:2,3-bisphosphoglycerate-independent phosphoglycerate mutase [Candidatus Dojkabacteria bacterium]|nr:2,3-bisphosphoglycerate-independent phosphoglycerate mutase [Candidatus Dojkabacteria bacterium]
MNTNISTKDNKKLCVLVVADGFGIRTGSMGNAIISANTPTMDNLWTQFPHTLLKASGKDVGLTTGDPGNSEVGHTNIGAGRIVNHHLPIINESIRTGEFKKNPKLVEIFEYLHESKKDFHLLGLLSAAGVHAHIEHLFKILELCREKKVNPFIHVILDGRDTSLKDGYIYMNMLLAKIQELGVGRIASISGRQYAMDRDKRWEQTRKAYLAMVGLGERKSTDPMDVLLEGYNNGENDQTFIPTTIICNDVNPVGVVKSGDVVLFYNYREDRVRQLTKVFVNKDFPFFQRQQYPEDVKFYLMTGYCYDLAADVLYEPQYINNTLSSVISDAGLTQIHIGETEKYAHVTFFLNGGHEDPRPGEKFIHISSPDVYDYSKTPHMSSEKVTDAAVESILSGKYNFVFVNLSNPDMIGHTGNFKATVEAVEFVDKCVKRIFDAVAKQDGVFILTSDHGNCEEMLDELTMEVKTSHTCNPVPFIACVDIASFDSKAKSVRIGTGPGSVETGNLADIAPTVLSLLGLPKTKDMTGIDLLAMIR